MITRANTTLVGMALIALGIYLLLAEYGFAFRVQLSWPIILAVVGGALIAAGLMGKAGAPKLLGGAIVLWLGIFFLVIENWLGAYLGYGRLWPGFLVAIGLGMITAGALSQELRHYHHKGAFLVMLGGVFFLFTLGVWQRFFSFDGISLFSIAVILIGVALLGSSFGFRGGGNDR